MEGDELARGSLALMGSQLILSNKPTTPNVPLVRVIWSPLGGIWGVLECS